MLDSTRRTWRTRTTAAAHGRGDVDPADDPGPARLGGRRHGDRAGAEPVDPRADPGGDARRPGDGPGRPRPGRARPRPATSWASWPTRSTRWPARSASSGRPGPPGCCGPRRRRRRRSTRSPTRSSSSTRAGSVERANPAARRILGVAPSDGLDPLGAAARAPGPPLAEVLGGRADYLPTGLEHAALPPRRRPGAVLPAPRPGDPRRATGRSAPPWCSRT